jgi:hypothetical protein
MSISGISSSLAGGSTYDFQSITPAKVLEASAELQQDGLLSCNEAQTLAGMASPSSWSPINGWNAQSLADFNNTVMQTPMDYLSILSNLVSTNATLGLTGEGAQQAAVDQSLYQKLSAYESESQSAAQTQPSAQLNLTA